MESGVARRVAILQGILKCSDPCIDTLAIHVKELILPAGSVLARKGDIPGGFFIVASGRLYAPRGLTFGQGAIVCFNDFIAGTVVPYDVTIIEQSTVYFINNSVYESIVASNCSFLGVLFKNVAVQNVIQEEFLFHKIEAQDEIAAQKDRFFNIIAHDLKSPYGTVVGFADLLANSSLNEPGKVQSFAQIILKSARNALNLLDNLLLWTRVKNGQVKPFITDINIVTIILDLYSTLAPVAERKGVSVSFEIVEITVMADQNLTYVIMKNILQNAVRYTQSGSITIATHLDGDWGIVSVTDTGKGMSNEELEALFRVDVKKNGTDENGEPGTGIGMVVVKEYVELCGGYINVSSSCGNGTRVEVGFNIR